MINICLACQDLVTEQKHALDSALQALSHADSVISIQQMRVINALGQAASSERQISVQEGLTANAKRKARKWKWACVGIIAAWVTVEVLMN